MTKSTITREQLLEIIETDHVQCGEASYLARMALAAMDSESGCLPLDYLQGHKDGLEWAAQLAEANHHETGDWLYDDPIELAKAIRKGPDMPPAQPVADSEPVAVIDLANLDYLLSGADADVWPPEREEMGDVLLYRHPQPAPVAPVCTCPSGDGSLRWPCPVHPGNSPVIPDGWTGSDKANAALMMLDRIETADPIDDDRIDGIKRIVRELAAAQHDTPALNLVRNVVTVPGKWIPVSERMPEEGGRYWCYVEEQNSLGKSHYQWNCSWNGDVWSDKALTGRVTHWMPLPAAPQEVSDA
ncbi:DUF551 domain-containing protein [Klebsiella pneumoniae]|uniref:DUF551 domain-containing protein n=1 Tax=Klebsiella pneumoniae TaxID=573 RepID=UPI0007CC87D3|nr:DUF551 domain-containing protein [Klebsiella pneumoniae]MDQ5696798.1 DUF551 domain-containing protein [Klebsiella pneumoniae]MDQ5707666.1 DUF551 domain-containing protein [Klebsiella pneumoniae]SAX72684.1 Eaa1 [Klebsiella pneumoniae]